MRTALYAGSFDPPTLGHLDIICRALGLCDALVIAIGVHPGKAPLFSFEDRKAMLEQACAGFAGADKLQVVTYAGLTIEAAAEHGASMLVRGLRDGTDLDYEAQIAAMNAVMAPSIETVFLMASSATRPITATLVRQIAAMGGNVTPFVPGVVANALRTRFSKPA